MQHGHTSQQGYTLMEMIVSVAIFSLAFIAIAAIFISFSAAQSRAGTSQRLLNEGNYIMESVVREIRKNTYDYSCASNSLTYICLKSLDGKNIHFRYNDPLAPGNIQVCLDYDAVPCPALSSKWTTINPSFLTINRVEFHTYPSSNPQAQDADLTHVYQPVTVVLMQMTAGAGRAAQTYDLQTAASSRVYSF